ncbi:TylF/MycF/NovP-related O-methyltransferase [Desulfococcaceae bacterium HSG7]|nr:TylF/MycF/NovP-related O-methyltransferase [Desulfococcaceae bacterium HSG7]
MTVKIIYNSVIRPLIRRCGIDIIKYRSKGVRKRTKMYPRDFTEHHRNTCDLVKPYTGTGPERVKALLDSVEYIVANKIDGAIVECGVWRGGSTMAMAFALIKASDETRDLYLYDTFAGMSKPTDVDISVYGDNACKTFPETMISEDASSWCLATLEDVKQNVFSTGYPKEKFHFIKGKVENTIPANIPKSIALLRLDTDWYESTKHELKHLFPLLKPNGILIIDDYGHWEGARKAVDEYIDENKLIILLNRIDYTGRIAVKTK